MSTHIAPTAGARIGVDVGGTFTDLVLHDAARNITRTGKLLPFKKGGFIMAAEAGVQIVPLDTVGGHRMLPPGAVHIRPGRYIVAFGAPVDPKAFENRDALMAEVRTRIEALRERALQL